VPKDPARAVALFKQACDGDDAIGCSRLANAYAHGRGVAVDEARAVALYGRSIALLTPSCDKGDAQDCDALGTLYVKGNGVPKDEARALALFTKACNGGSALGCANLAIMYANGEGVTGDQARALALYQHACDGGTALACSNLGLMYKRGENVPKDEARALALFTKACAGDYALGCSNLGNAYATGEGATKDEQRALALYKQACDGDSAYGCAKLGELYEEGRGVPKDPARAVALYEQACDAGSDFGCTLLNENNETSSPHSERLARNEKAPGLADCPKGQVVIDTNTGKAIECTGVASAASPAWLVSLGRIVRDPKGAKPSAVDKTDPNEVSYTFALPPFSEVVLTVHGRDPAQWDLGLTSTSIGAKGLAASGAPTRLCRMGISTWYAIEEGDGPLGGSFASAADPDTNGNVTILVVSAQLAALEKARDEAKGAAPTRSIRESLCR
jgi:TPR repeat protein